VDIGDLREATYYAQVAREIKDIILGLIAWNTRE
jgi:hypothetical protein